MKWNRRLNRTISFVVVSVLVLSSILGCSKKKTLSQEVKVGVIAPLTGELATYGERQKNAFVLASEEINKAGGIDGKKLTLVIEDSKTTPAGAVSAAQKLINVDRVPVIIGETASSLTLAISPIAEKAKIVLLTPISSNDNISEAGDYIFRLAPYDSLQSVIVAKWFKDLGYNTAAVLYINNDYGKGLNDSFVREFQKQGGKVVISEAIGSAKRDFRTQLAKIKNAAPDAIFSPLYPEEAGVMLRQKKQLGIDIPVVGTDPFHDPKIFELAGDAAEGILFTDVAPGSGSVWQRLKSTYMDRFDREPDIVVAEAYDAVKLIAFVMNQVGTDPARIKDALYELEDYEGAIGQITFDDKGDNISKTFYKYKIENGQYLELGE